MDTGLGSQYLEKLNPFSSKSSHPNEDDTQMEPWALRDSSTCQTGAEIVLKRLVKKLFNQINEVQPNELDEELIFQTTFTYNDYLKLLNVAKDSNQMNCANLNKMENILSNFLTDAQVARPIHRHNLLLHTSNDYYFNFIGQSNYVRLAIVLLTVGLVAGVLRNRARLSMWSFLPLSMILVGFVEFCMYRVDVASFDREKCKNPSWIARLFGYHDNSKEPSPNIALLFVDFLSELTIQPIAKLGKAINSFLNSFSGLNYLVGPFFSIALAFTFLLFAWLVLRTRVETRRQLDSRANANRTPRNNKWVGHRRAIS